MVRPHAACIDPSHAQNPQPYHRPSRSGNFIHFVIHSDYAVTATRRAMSVDLTVDAGGTGQQPSDDEVIALAREAIEASREESRRGRDGVLSTDLQQPGVTVNLGHRNIVRLPDEAIDIIKQEIERCVNLFILRRNKCSSPDTDRKTSISVRLVICWPSLDSR